MPCSVVSWVKSFSKVTHPADLGARRDGLDDDVTWGMEMRNTCKYKYKVTHPADLGVGRDGLDEDVTWGKEICILVNEIDIRLIINGADDEKAIREGFVDVVQDTREVQCTLDIVDTDVVFCHLNNLIGCNKQ